MKITKFISSAELVKSVIKGLWRSPSQMERKTMSMDTEHCVDIGSLPEGSSDFLLVHFKHLQEYLRNLK